MIFAELNAEFVHLRGSLRTFVGEGALEEISVSPPASNDEASFLRLITWSYILVFEAGRITIPYLLKLPSGLEYPQRSPFDARTLLHDLRTWCSHNLAFEKDHDLAISKRVSLWFIDSCGVNPPIRREHWRSCFHALCSEIGKILAHCRGAVAMVLGGREDGEAVITDLRFRLDRNWPAHRFDELVSDAATRIGQMLDAQRFRETRIAKWREFLETIPQADEPEVQLGRLIERDVLDHFESVLPIDGNDVMMCLNIGPGPKVAEALRNARRLSKLGIAGRDDLLASLAGEYSTSDGPSSNDLDSGE